jgi:hypothetical protein
MGTRRIGDIKGSTNVPNSLSSESMSQSIALFQQALRGETNHGKADLVRDNLASLESKRQYYAAAAKGDALFNAALTMDESRTAPSASLVSAYISAGTDLILEAISAHTLLQPISTWWCSRPPRTKKLSGA